MKKSLKIVLIVIGVLLILVVGGVIYGFSRINAAANADEYVISNNKIPSIKAVVGKRKVSSVSSNVSTDITQKTYTYTKVDKPNEDVVKYVKHLVENNNFLITSNSSIDSPTGTIQISEKAKDEGNIIIMDIDWSVGSYTISMKYGKGTLNKAD